MRVYLPLIPLYIKYKTGMRSNLSREQMRIEALKGFNKIFIGMTKQEIDEYFSITCNSIIELLNKSVVEEVKKAKNSDFHTVILSGAYSLLLKDIGEHLGIDTIIGTEMYFKNDKFDNDKELNLVSGSCKIDKLHSYFENHEIDWSKSYAYADSFSDIDLLKSVGNPVIVNPDEKLKSIGLEKNWRLIS